MKATNLDAYNDIIHKVEIFYNNLKLSKYESKTGRKLAIPIKDILALALFKQEYGIETKRDLYQIFKPDCSYKTLVVNLNRFFPLALLILAIVMQINRLFSHIVKHTDSTDLPVCSNRKAKYHQTMKFAASWKKSSKGSFYGLKLHITTDLQRKLLSIKFTTGRVDDRDAFEDLNKDLTGIFIVDAGYISQELAKRFYREGQRIMLAKPRKNMRKLATKFQNMLYSTRKIIEFNFRSLKMFYGLVTSLPRSVEGYFANYIYSLLAYSIA